MISVNHLIGHTYNVILIQNTRHLCTILYGYLKIHQIKVFAPARTTNNFMGKLASWFQTGQVIMVQINKTQ